MLLGKRILVKKVEGQELSEFEKNVLDVGETFKKGEVVEIGLTSELGLSVGDTVRYEHGRPIVLDGQDLVAVDDEDIWVK